jgi:hypothetical protein
VSQRFTFAAISGFACWFWLSLPHFLFATPDIGLAVGLGLAAFIILTGIRSGHRADESASDRRFIAQER